jgi:V8-like Glu-specific endopeptidase
MRSRFVYIVLLSLQLLAGTFSFGQGNNRSFTVIRNTASPEEVRAFWTPERMASAQPEPMPEVPIEKILENQALEENLPVPSGPRFWAPGQMVGEGTPPNPAQEEAAANFDPDSLPPAKGTRGLNYTSTRLIPQAADILVPYRTTGKLFFMNGALAFTCTASVIRLRVLLTAGHCVNDGNGTTFTNFMFVPALRGNIRPLGTWTWVIAYIPNTWLNGGGVLPNAADYAVMVMADQNIGHGVQTLGAAIGYTLGFATFALRGNELVILGYPCNLNRTLMHQVFSGQTANGGNNTVLYGDDMEQGSSGGPWIQDFGIREVGQVAGGTNQVVGVASYTIDPPTPPQTCTTNPVRRALGASIFDNRFRDIVVAACAQAVGNC